MIAVDGVIVFGFAEHGRFVLDTSGRGSRSNFDTLRARVAPRPVEQFPGRARQPFDAVVWCVPWLLPPFLWARRWWRPDLAPHS